MAKLPIPMRSRRPTSRRDVLAWLAAGTTLLQGCNRVAGAGPGGRFKGMDISGAPYGRDFSLTDHRGRVRTLGVGAAVALIATLLLPGWTKSSLGEMVYWVDWANLLVLASGFVIAAMAWTWPLAAMRRRPQ